MIIPHNWEIPESIKQRVGVNTYGRQRAIIEGGHLLLMLHKKPAADQDERDGILFWRTPEGEWRSSQGGKSVQGLKDFIEGYIEAHDELEDAYDNARSAKDLFKLLESVIPLKRAASHMFQAVQSAREQLPDYTDIIELRDTAYDAERRFDILWQDARNAVDFRIAQESEEQAELSKEALSASHKLNLLAAMFFPLTAVASLFGMNMTSGLEELNILVFWSVFVIGGVVGFVMKGWVVKPAQPAVVRASAGKTSAGGSKQPRR